MNIIDKAVEYLSPEAALRRDTARKVLAAQRAYEAAQHSRLRKIKTDPGSGDAITERAGDSLRLQARHLDENHDLAGGVLDVLVNHTIGRGLSIEPQVKLNNGELATSVNDQLLELWEDWTRFPEVTGEYHWNHMVRLIARHWFRDGEVLIKHVQGNRRDLNHGTIVPYSLELIEADYLPFELNDQKQRITHGVEKNVWRRPRAYHLYDDHPGDPHTLTLRQNTRRHLANQIIHLKVAKRISQTRGVSVFANVMTRLEDIKDYELSERMAAKVAASMCAYIRKSLDGPLNNNSTDADGNRTMKMQPGLIFDNLLPGEEVGMIDANRPNNMLEPFRNSQMRAVAAGTGTGFSSIARDYRGTYSSQRQEMVEQSVSYVVLREYIVERAALLIWERFVRMAILSGHVEISENVNKRSVTKAGCYGPVIPWLDPDKEAKAEERLIQAGLKARAQSIRERGGNPQNTFDQIRQEREQDKEAGLHFSTTLEPNKQKQETENPNEQGDDNAQEDEPESES